MKKQFIIIIFFSLLNIISFGQDAHAWKIILNNSKTFEVKRDKYKMPSDVLNRLFDSIANIANPKEKVNACTGGKPNIQLKWFAVDKAENYVVFVTSYGFHNRNLCFLLTRNSQDKPLVIEKLQGDIDFKDLKTIYLNQGFTVDTWPD